VEKTTGEVSTTFSWPQLGDIVEHGNVCMVGTASDRRHFFLTGRFIVFLIHIPQDSFPEENVFHKILN
jgi:hypothetical protein